MLKLSVVLLPTLLLASIPAFAQTQPSQPAQQVQQPKPANGASAATDPNRKICKTEELIGSRTGGTRICKTAAQWEADRRQAQNSGDDE